MKILHLLDIPWWSGLANYALESAVAHKALNHEVFFACEKNSLSLPRAQKEGVPVVPIYGRKFWDTIKNFFVMGFWIQKNKPDLIVAHTGSAQGLAFIWGKIFAVPFIRTRAAAQPVQKNWINRYIYKCCYIVVTASSHLKELFLDRLGNDFADQVRVIYPPVFCPEIAASDAAKKIGLLARLDPVKGHRFFLEAAALVQQKFPDSEWHFAGPEENIRWGSLLKIAKNLGLNHVYYHGFLEEEAVQTFLKNCTIGVIASVDSEELSRAALEWMSQGKPLVATNVGSIKEIVVEAKGGWMVPIAEPKIMAEKIIDLLENPQTAKEMGLFNHQRCQNQFSKKMFQDVWRDVLKDI